MAYQREYACSQCGLIYFGYCDFNKENKYEPCPECGNDSKGEHHLYTCDSMGWVYVSETVKNDLRSRNKSFHYHKNHPWHNKR